MLNVIIFFSFLREKLTVNLEKMANLKNEMDSSSSSEMRIPIELFAALDKKDQTSLDAFEKQLMKQAVEKGDEMRAQARQRQVRLEEFLTPKDCIHFSCTNCYIIN